jgi:hypothetical protein
VSEHAELPLPWKHALTVPCPMCGVAAGEPCVYTDGPFLGLPKRSGPHGTRMRARRNRE